MVISIILKNYNSGTEEGRKRAIDSYNKGIENLEVLQSLSIIPTVNTAQRPSDRFVSFQPQNLLSGIWLILGGILSSGVNLKNCQYKPCNRWFQDRPRKTYCSNKCRTYAYRLSNREQ
jgi:hypothetical protein